MRRRSASVSVSFFAFQDIITSVVGIFVLVVLCMILELVDRTDESRSPPMSTISADTLVQLENRVAERQREYAELQRSVTKVVSANKWNEETRRREMIQATANADSESRHVADMIAEANAAVAVARQAQIGLEKQYIAAGSTRQKMESLGDRAEKLEVQIAELKSDDVMIFRDVTPDGKQLVLVDVTSTAIIVSDALSAAQESFTGTKRIDDFDNWLAKKQLGARRFLVFVRPDAVAAFGTVKEKLESSGASYGYDVLPSAKKVRLLTQAAQP